MTFVQWVEYHARSILFVALFLSIAGAFAVTTLPVGLFPQVAFPRVQVSLDAGDRPADQMAQQVTRPVEEALRVIPGVQDVRSTTSRGGAEISVDFGWGSDMTAATLQVDTALSHIMPSLPAGTTSTTRRMEPTVFPIIAYGLTSDKVSITDLRDLVKYQIRPLLTAIPGLGQGDLVGGADAEVQVLVDPHKLDAYGLSTLGLGLRADHRQRAASDRSTGGSLQALHRHLEFQHGRDRAGAGRGPEDRPAFRGRIRDVADVKASNRAAMDPRRRRRQGRRAVPGLPAARRQRRADRQHGADKLATFKCRRASRSRTGTTRARWSSNRPAACATRS